LPAAEELRRVRNRQGQERYRARHLGEHPTLSRDFRLAARAALERQAAHHNLTLTPLIEKLALDADRRPGDFDKGQETRASQTKSVWSDEEVEKLRTLYATHSASAIARQLRRRLNAVKSKAQNWGLKSGASNSSDPAGGKTCTEVEAVVHRRDRGLTPAPRHNGAGGRGFGAVSLFDHHPGQWSLTFGRSFIAARRLWTPRRGASSIPGASLTAMASGSDGLRGGQRAPRLVREAHGGELERGFCKGAEQLERRITSCREAALVAAA
jgi:hypothetical protein